MLTMHFRNIVASLYMRTIYKTNVINMLLALQLIVCAQQHLCVATFVYEIMYGCVECVNCVEDDYVLIIIIIVFLVVGYLKRFLKIHFCAYFKLNSKFFGKCSLNI